MTSRQVVTNLFTDLWIRHDYGERKKYGKRRHGNRRMEMAKQKTDRLTLLPPNKPDCSYTDAANRSLQLRP